MAKMENTFLWEKATAGDATFKSGEKVSDVDYLGLSNKAEIDINTENIRDLAAQVLDCTKVDSFYKITRIVTLNAGDSYVVLIPNISVILVPGYNYHSIYSSSNNLYYLPVSIESIAFDGSEAISLGAAQFGIVPNATGGKDFVIASIGNSDQSVCVSYLCSDKNG